MSQIKIKDTDIVIGFSRAKSPWKVGSDIIQMSEKRNFSHVYIRYKCPLTNIIVVAQASHGFVNEVEFNTFQDRNIIVKEYKITATRNEFLSVLIFLRKNLGKEYSKLQLFFIALKKLFRVEVNIDNKDEAFICSELAAKIAQVLGVEIQDKLDLVTPSDVDRFLRRARVELIYNG